MRITQWVYVGSPLTPNALNDGQAGFPEFHNVYIEPCSYEAYKKTNVFPEGTVFFKELQLVLPGAGYGVAVLLLAALFLLSARRLSFHVFGKMGRAG